MTEVNSHYPVWQIDTSLVRNKLQHAAVSDAMSSGVGELEEHRILNVQSCLQQNIVRTQPLERKNFC